MKPVILVVDDDTAVCELLQDVLTEHVFSVQVCHNGQQALAVAASVPHLSLVLLDMMLPDINGLLVLQPKATTGTASGDADRAGQRV